MSNLDIYNSNITTENCLPLSLLNSNTDFVIGTLQTETASVDADIQKEYARQREHLERSVASLRKKLSKDTEIHRADNVRIMQVGTK